ncbi:hypothetical protein ACFE04_001430 [Oxalis oulophora]
MEGENHTNNTKPSPQEVPKDMALANPEVLKEKPTDDETKPVAPPGDLTNADVHAPMVCPRCKLDMQTASLYAMVQNNQRESVETPACADRGDWWLGSAYY